MNKIITQYRDYSYHWISIFVSFYILRTVIMKIYFLCSQKHIYQFNLFKNYNWLRGYWGQFSLFLVIVLLCIKTVDKSPCWVLSLDQVNYPFRVSRSRNRINQINKVLLDFIPFTKFWEIFANQKYSLLTEATSEIRYLQGTFSLHDKSHIHTHIF